MSGLTTRQVIAEIFRDYNYELSAGNDREHSLDMLKAALVDLIESEKEQSFDTGVKSGRLGLLNEQQFQKKVDSPK